MEKKTSDYSDYDPNRLCTQNQYTNALNLPLNDIAGLMDQWLANITLHEKTLMANRKNMEHNHGRFDAFQVMGDCNVDCVLLQLEEMKVVETMPGGGRRVTRVGQQDLDRIAGTCVDDADEE